MLTFLGFMVFIFGCIIGSFLNVLVLRYNTGRTVGGRSFCFSCGKTLSALELVPILSFVLSLGKCRGCKSKISWQYPLVEFVTGLVFMIIFLREVLIGGSIAAIVFYSFVFSILIAISVYDLRHKIVPDLLVFVFGAASLLWLLLSHSLFYFATLHGVLDLLAGPILFAPFFALWYASDGAWMGLGDGKLALGIGWMLGFVRGVSAIILGFWSAAIFALALMAIQFAYRSKPSRLNAKSEIPFAPFLVLGALLAYIFNPDLFNLGALIFGM
ncbi:MAG: prepilin peptidase [Patescibacteria group bacterium]